MSQEVKNISTSRLRNSCLIKKTEAATAGAEAVARDVL